MGTAPSEPLPACRLHLTSTASLSCPSSPAAGNPSPPETLIVHCDDGSHLRPTTHLTHQPETGFLVYKQHAVQQHCSWKGRFTPAAKAGRVMRAETSEDVRHRAYPSMSSCRYSVFTKRLASSSSSLDTKNFSTCTANTAPAMLCTKCRMAAAAWSPHRSAALSTPEVPYCKAKP